MSIIEETRAALLTLFPEQTKAEEEAEALAVQAAAQAEADAAAEPELVAESAPEEEIAEVAADEKAEDTTEKPKKKPVAKKKEKVEEPPREPGLLDTDHATRGTVIDVYCDASQVVEAAKIMDEAGFFLESVTAVDWLKEEKMEVVYDYNHFAIEQSRVVVRAFVSREEPAIDTVSGVFPSADWHERETWDFFGIDFKGHPNQIRILLPEDADFHPLLKDFSC